MITTLLSKIGLVIDLLLVLILLSACCHYPRARVTQLSGGKTQVPTITLVAYGDSRTGPWGLGDNEKQALHGKVIDDIFANNDSIDAVLFTGDAVMSNFALWRKAYWRCFLNQCNRFHKANIPFYPTLGNHEVLSPIVPLMKVTALSGTQTGTRILAEQDMGRRIAAAYDAGERAAESARPTPEVEGQPLDPSTKQGQALLKRWERAIGKGDAASAYQFGQFEGYLQKSFYALGAEKDERCSADARTFSEDYLKQGKYDYLRPLLKGRSYYSKILEKTGIRVKLIALDTNCLDSQRQQDFFATEVKNFDGPIIVFGHHPPVDYDKPGASWDLVPGWGHHDDEGMKHYISLPEGKKIVLWIFGHVHDYQRRGAANIDQQAVAPVLVVAGGGGASPLDAATAAFQWQPASWPAPMSRRSYNHVKVSVTAGGVAVEVRGADNSADDFKVIDSFTIPVESVRHN